MSEVFTSRLAQYWQRRAKIAEETLALIRAEARAELARIERDGGSEGFALRVLEMAGEEDA